MIHEPTMLLNICALDILEICPNYRAIIMIFIKMMTIICYLEDEASCDNVTHCTFIVRLALIKYCFIVA